ncbi:MAG TPA: thioredoxin [Patescibacteria group bacterium]|jgi:thioredoxin 1|nr:thioredoxin [Patescibacteria group bacterium]
MAVINTTTNDEFKTKVLQSDKVVLVDFWAGWCMPCRMMAPILENVAAKMDKDIDVVKVDVEATQDNAMLANTYGVQGIPNMQIFKNGKMVNQLIGMRPQAVLEQELSQLV